MSRLGQKDEFLRTIASPARGNRDPIFVIDQMPELSSIEAFGFGIGVHWSVAQSSILPHLTPLLTTCATGGQ